MKDLIENYLGTIETTNDKKTYEKTVQQMTKSLKTVDNKEYLELVKQAYIKSVDNANRFGYTETNSDVTIEEIETLKCFSTLLNILFKLKKR